MEAQDLVTVGEITSVHGIKGWVKIYSFTDPKANIFAYGPWYLQALHQEGVFTELEIDQHRPQGQGLVAHLKGVDDREQAREYCRREILIPRQRIPALPEGEYYWYQLQGVAVYSSYSGSPQLLGRVSKMMETGANDVMVLAPCEGSIDEKERLVPFVPAQYQTQVSLEDGKVTLDWDPEF